MNKLILHAAAASIVLGVSASQVALAEPARGVGTDILAFCRVHITEPGFTTGTLGECTSYVHTLFQTDDGFVSHYCDGLEETMPDIFYAMFESKDECIRYYRSHPIG